MRSVKFVVLGVFALALLSTVSLLAEEKDKEKPKFTIKEVMQKAMKGGLCVKVAKGKASDEEKTELVALFTALGQNKPPKGDAKAWATRTKALVDAAKSADGKALGKAADCKSCHEAFRPPEEK